MFKGNNERTGYFIYTNDSECNTSLGDVNGDNSIDILDVVLAVNIVLGTAGFSQAADMNDDGIVNVLDVIQLINLILS